MFLLYQIPFALINSLDEILYPECSYDVEKLNLGKLCRAASYKINISLIFKTEGVRSILESWNCEV